MSDEQTIYISPDDDLTTVRERLEEIPARRVMLVIPSQTQLRSHVAWKLLYASMRELGKDVLIVSSDPQIRSVAHAVKFNVAHSLESSQVNRSTRTPSHPTRNTPTSRRSTSSMVRPAPNAGRVAPPAPPEVEQTIRKQADQTQKPPQAPIPFERSRFQANEEQESNDFLAADPQQDRDVPTQRNRYGQSYDFGVNRSSQILPLQQEQIDEEPDLLIEDYQQSQNIRQAANAGKQVNSEKQEGTKAERTFMPASIGENVLPAEQVRPSQSSALKEDPFDSLTDTQASPTAEQHGGVSFAGFETQEHIIQDAPEVQAPFIVPQRSVPEPAPKQRPAQKAPTRTSRSLGNANNPALRETTRRPPTNRDLPQRPRNSTPLRSQPLSYQEEDALPPPPVNNQSFTNQAPKRSSKALQPEGRVENRNESYTRAPARVQSAPLPVSTSTRQQRISRNLTPPATPSPATRLSDHLPPPAKAKKTTQGLRPAPSRSQLVASQRNKKRGSWLAFLVILLVIVLLALAAFIPTANVTIIVQSRDYAHAVSVIAHPAASNQTNAVVAHQYTHTFQATGQGKATGTKTVNKARATGSVCFINNGGNSIEIPTGSIVATGQNGAQFATTADVVISAHSSCTSSPPDPVQAVSAGESGNVAAGVVTTIPTTSLNAIAQYNKTSASNLNLTVNNPTAIGGGGMQPFPAVTTTDRTNVQQTLHQQLQSNVNTWLKSLPQNGVAGKPFTTDMLIDTPAVDTVINSGNTFSATVQENVTVLFVSTVDLQKAATTQLNTVIHNDKTYSGYEVIQDAFAQVRIAQVKQQNPDANTLDITYNATAQAAPSIPLSTVQDEARGKSIASAQAELMQDLKSRGVQQVKIAVTPGFIPWVTPLTAHIAVHEIPTTTQVTQPTK